MKKADSAKLLKTKGFIYIFLSKMPLVNYFIALNVKKINEILFQIVFPFFFILVLLSYFSILSYLLKSYFVTLPYTVQRSSIL